MSASFSQPLHDFYYSSKPPATSGGVRVIPLWLVESRATVVVRSKNICCSACVAGRCSLPAALINFRPGAEPTIQTRHLLPFPPLPFRLIPSRFRNL